MARQKSNPLVAAFFGILLVPGSVLLQAWNEYRTIHRTRGLNEAAEIVEPIADPQSVATDLNGKLVHLSGEAITDETLSDAKFGIQANGIALRRRVEMYQWDEDKKTDDGHTTYHYQRVWREGRIDSSGFNQSGSHANPSPQFDSWEQTADRVMVGRYELSDSLKSQKDDAGNVRFDIDSVRQTLGGQDAAKIFAAGDHLYYAANATVPSPAPTPENPSASETETSQAAKNVDPESDTTVATTTETATTPANRPPASPEIGDLKIRFELIPNGPVSLMSGLSGETFASYQTSNGEPIDRLYPGTFTAEQVIEKLRQENAVIAWLLRGLGFVLCLVGMLMIFSPAQAIFRWIPLVGDITGGLIFLVSGLVAVTLSLVTISVSWIAVRPVFGISLLVIAGAAVYLLVRTNRKVHHPGGDEPMMLTDDMMVS